MSNLDLFGNPVDVQALMDAPITGPKKRKPTLPRGHAALPGTGPAGETCKTCAHLERVEFAKTYLKCGKMRAHWTGGPGTDVRAKDAACSNWSYRLA